MLYDFRRLGRIPRGNNAVRIVSFSIYIDVIINGNVTAKRRGLISKPYVLEGRRGNDSTNVNRTAQNRIQRRLRVPRVLVVDRIVNRVHPTDYRSRREGRNYI